MKIMFYAKPLVYTDEPDEVEEMLTTVRRSAPDVVILDLPRGMAAPRREPYLQSAILDGLEHLGYTAVWDEQRGIDGRKRVIVQARIDGHRAIWGRDLPETIALQTSS